MSLITRACSNCGREFTSQPNWNKIYCSHSCYKKAKVVRRKMRDLGVVTTTEDTSQFVSILKYPTKEALDSATNFVTEDRPIKVIGMNFMYQPPKGFDFVQQPTLENPNNDEWLLVKQISFT